MGKHIENNKQKNTVGEEELGHLHIYEYDKPTYGLTKSGFIDCVLVNAKEVNIKRTK